MLHLNESQIELLRQRHEEGASIRTLSNESGIPYGTLMSRIAQKQDITFRKPHIEDKKFTPAQVRKISALYIAGESFKNLAADYNCSEIMIRKIATGELYKWIERDVKTYRGVFKHIHGYHNISGKVIISKEIINQTMEYTDWTEIKAKYVLQKYGKEKQVYLINEFTEDLFNFCAAHKTRERKPANLSKRKEKSKVIEKPIILNSVNNNKLNRAFGSIKDIVNQYRPKTTMTFTEFVQTFLNIYKGQFKTVNEIYPKFVAFSECNNVRPMNEFNFQQIVACIIYKNSTMHKFINRHYTECQGDKVLGKLAYIKYITEMPFMSIQNFYKELRTQGFTIDHSTDHYMYIYNIKEKE